MWQAWLTKHITIKKAISIIVTAAFFVSLIPQDVLAAIDTGDAPYEMPYGEAATFARLDVDTFTVPGHLGEVKYSFKGDSDKFLIHLQDAHCNCFAQRKVSDIIDYLNKEYGLKVINLEGGVGDYDLDIFTSISGKEIRREVADYFVKKGELNGAEFYAINNPEKVSLWGIEDKDLYLANLKVYRDSLSYKPEVNKYLEELTHILNNLKRHIFTPELLKIDMAYNAYKAGNMDFRDYLQFLIKEADENAINVKTYKNLYLLSQAMEMEDEVDFKKANSERGILIEELKGSLSREEVRGLVSKTVEFKTKRLSRRAFYNYLLEKAKEVDIKSDRFPALSGYIVYVSTYEAVDRSMVMDELDAFEAEIKKPLLKKDVQRQLDLLSHNLAIIKNVFDIHLTKTDYRYYLLNKNAFEISAYLSFIEKQAPKYKIKARPDANITNLDVYRERISKFYEYSFKRDDIFLENLQFSAVSGGIQGAVLMTGGFHTENLCELFEGKGISYISILPKFKMGKNYESPYFDILAGQVTDVQQMLRSVMARAAMLQVASMLSKALAESVWGKDALAAFRAAVKIQEMIERKNKVVLTDAEGNTLEVGGNLLEFGKGEEKRIQIGQLMTEVGYEGRAEEAEAPEAEEEEGPAIRASESAIATLAASAIFAASIITMFMGVAVPVVLQTVMGVQALILAIQTYKAYKATGSWYKASATPADIDNYRKLRRDFGPVVARFVQFHEIVHDVARRAGVEKGSRLDEVIAYVTTYLLGPVWATAFILLGIAGILPEPKYVEIPSVTMDAMFGEDEYDIAALSSMTEDLDILRAELVGILGAENRELINNILRMLEVQAYKTYQMAFLQPNLGHIRRVVDNVKNLMKNPAINNQGFQLVYGEKAQDVAVLGAILSKIGFSHNDFDPAKRETYGANRVFALELLDGLLRRDLMSALDFTPAQYDSFRESILRSGSFGVGTSDDYSVFRTRLRKYPSADMRNMRIDKYANPLTTLLTIAGDIDISRSRLQPWQQTPVFMRLLGRIYRNPVLVGRYCNMVDLEIQKTREVTDEGKRRIDDMLERQRSEFDSLLGQTIEEEIKADEKELKENGMYGKAANYLKGIDSKSYMWFVSSYGLRNVEVNESGEIIFMNEEDQSMSLGAAARLPHIRDFHYNNLNKLLRSIKKRQPALGVRLRKRTVKPRRYLYESIKNTPRADIHTHLKMSVDFEVFIWNGIMLNPEINTSSDEHLRVIEKSQKLLRKLRGTNDINLRDVLSNAINVRNAMYDFVYNFKRGQGEEYSYPKNMDLLAEDMRDILENREFEIELSAEERRTMERYYELYYLLKHHVRDLFNFQEGPLPDFVLHFMATSALHKITREDELGALKRITKAALNNYADDGVTYFEPRFNIGSFEDTRAEVLTVIQAFEEWKEENPDKEMDMRIITSITKFGGDDRLLPDAMRREQKTESARVLVQVLREALAKRGQGEYGLVELKDKETGEVVARVEADKVAPEEVLRYLAGMDTAGQEEYNQPDLFFGAFDVIQEYNREVGPELRIGTTTHVSESVTDVSIESALRFGMEAVYNRHLREDEGIPEDAAMDRVGHLIVPAYNNYNKFRGTKRGERVEERIEQIEHDLTLLRAGLPLLAVNEKDLRAELKALKEYYPLSVRERADDLRKEIAVLEAAMLTPETAEMLKEARKNLSRMEKYEDTRPLTDKEENRLVELSKEWNIDIDHNVTYVYDTTAKIIDLETRARFVLDNVIRHGVVVETNPTSNVGISPDIEAYGTHTMRTYMDYRYGDWARSEALRFILEERADKGDKSAAQQLAFLNRYLGQAQQKYAGEKVKSTINTDDLTLFETTSAEEFYRIGDAMNVPIPELLNIMEQGFLSPIGSERMPPGARGPPARALANEEDIKKKFASLRKEIFDRSIAGRAASEGLRDVSEMVRRSREIRTGDVIVRDDGEEMAVARIGRTSLDLKKRWEDREISDKIEIEDALANVDSNIFNIYRPGMDITRYVRGNAEPLRIGDRILSRDGTERIVEAVRGPEVTFILRERGNMFKETGDTADLLSIKIFPGIDAGNIHVYRPSTDVTERINMGGALQVGDAITDMTQIPRMVRKIYENKVTVAYDQRGDLHEKTGERRKLENTIRNEELNVFRVRKEEGIKAPASPIEGRDKDITAFVLAGKEDILAGDKLVSASGRELAVKDVSGDKVIFAGTASEVFPDIAAADQTMDRKTVMEIVKDAERGIKVLRPAVDITSIILSGADFQVSDVIIDSTGKGLEMFGQTPDKQKVFYRVIGEKGFDISGMPRKTLIASIREQGLRAFRYPSTIMTAEEAAAATLDGVPRKIRQEPYVQAVNENFLKRAEAKAKDGDYIGASLDYGEAARLLEAYMTDTMQDVSLTPETKARRARYLSEEIIDARSKERATVLQQLNDIMTEPHKDIFDEYCRIVYEEFAGMEVANEYHDFQHTMDDVRIVAQAIARMKEKGREVNSKNALKTMLAALFHDIGYSQPDVKTHNHVQKSIEYVHENLTRDIEWGDLRYTFDDKKDLRDIEIMIASTSITPLQFESQPTVARLRKDQEAGRGITSQELKDMKDMLLVADLSGAAATPRYFSMLTQLYREFAISVKSDMFGSALQLTSGTAGFQGFVAKVLMLAPALGLNVDPDTGEKIDDPARITKMVTDYIADNVLTEEQMRLNEEHMATSNAIKAAYEKLKAGEAADSEIEKVRERKEVFLGPNILRGEKQQDFDDMVFLLEMMNRIAKGQVIDKASDRTRLRGLKNDPAFECDATIVLALDLVRDRGEMTEAEREKQGQEIAGMFARIEELRSRKQTKGEVDYGFDQLIAEASGYLTMAGITPALKLPGTEAPRRIPVERLRQIANGAEAKDVKNYTSRDKEITDANELIQDVAAIPGVPDGIGDFVIGNVRIVSADLEEESEALSFMESDGTLVILLNKAQGRSDDYFADQEALRHMIRHEFIEASGFVTHGDIKHFEFLEKGAFNPLNKIALKHMTEEELERIEKTHRSDPDGVFYNATRVELEVRRAKKVLSLARPDIPAAILLPLTEDQMIEERSKHQSVTNETRRVLEKKYGSHLRVLYYVRGDVDSLNEAREKALKDRDFSRDDKARILAFVTGEIPPDAVKNFRESEKVAGVVNEDLEEDQRVNEVMHVVLGLGLIDYTRTGREEMKGRIRSLLSSMVEDAAALKDMTMEELLNGAFSVRIRRIDYGEITEWAEAQHAVLRSL
jgi:adenosine deaminase